MKIVRQAWPIGPLTVALAAVWIAGGPICAADGPADHARNPAAVYDLETGKVNWLGGHPAQDAIIALANQATTDPALASSKESFGQSATHPTLFPR